MSITIVHRLPHPVRPVLATESGKVRVTDTESETEWEKENEREIQRVQRVLLVTSTPSYTQHASNTQLPHTKHPTHKITLLHSKQHTTIQRYIHKYHSTTTTTTATTTTTSTTITTSTINIRITHALLNTLHIHKDMPTEPPPTTTPIPPNIICCCSTIVKPNKNKEINAIQSFLYVPLYDTATQKRTHTNYKTRTSNTFDL